MYSYKYPRPALTTDCAVFCHVENTKYVLLIERAQEPFANTWALPGGFVDMNEDLEQAAYRELKEETGFENCKLEQFKTYGKVNRDPRGRTVSVVYKGTLKLNKLPKVTGMDDAKQAQWWAVDNLPKLAFDHDLILSELLNSKL